MTLRKNIFMYEDRMSLYRSTFIFDELTHKFYRLSYIFNYIKIPEIQNINEYIFTSSDKFYKFNKKIKKVKNNHIINNQLLDIQKKLNKIMQNKLTFYFLKKNHIRLFEEINNFIILNNGLIFLTSVKNILLNASSFLQSNVYPPSTPKYLEHELGSINFLKSKKFFIVFTSILMICFFYFSSIGILFILPNTPEKISGFVTLFSKTIE